MPDTGRHYLAIPGPSVMPDAVLQAMHRPAPNIYTGEIHDITRSLVPDLCAVARTAGHVAMYIGNGHAMWEASLTNVLSRGDKVLALVNGRFGEGWANVAGALGAQVQRIDFGLCAAPDPARVQQALAADTAQAIKAVTVTHVDTATSALTDVSAIRQAMDAAGHPALLMVDCVASLACDRFEMDAWGVDVAISASQKGLMTPPGMGFIFCNDRARRAGATANCRTPYWDWAPRIDADEVYRYFDGTSPTHHIFALRKALDMIHDEGIEHVWARHDLFARAYWAAFDAWGQGGSMRINMTDPATRSRAVTTLRLDPPQGTALREWLIDKAGVTLGIGLGMVPPGDPAADGYFRVAHMGYVNMNMVMGVIGAMDAGMKALGIAHGERAADAAAQVMASA